MAEAAGPGHLPVEPEFIHHVGIVVRDMDRAITTFKSVFGLEPGIDFVGKAFPVRMAFLRIGQMWIELLQPLEPDGDDPAATALRERGEGLHHLCFEVTDIGKGLAVLDAAGVPLADRVPRRGHAGLFGYLRADALHGVVVELLDHQGTDPDPTVSTAR
jgi:methylmalonyl-CoA epimerase